jgi:hypothetical protein
MIGKSALAILTLSLTAAAGPAQVLFSDGFETYAPGAIDANLAGGPNQAPNGGPGNPWFGPAPPNLHVVGPGGGLSSGAAGPNSGNQMLTANAVPNDFDQNWYNLAHRLNNGNNYTGSVALKWAFYDPNGAGDANYRDYVALGNYTTAAQGAAANLDYTAASGGNLNPGGASQRISLGASNPTGFDPNFYQARVVGATGGLVNGWFNLSVPRTPGWHLAQILLGADQGTSTPVSFFIDNLNTPVLTVPISTSGGVNVIELNDAFGATAANFDDVSVSVPVPEPSGLGLAACGLLAVWRCRSRRTN